MGPILKPTDVGAHLFRVKGELETMLRSVKSWRTSGLDGTGLVPISALPLEIKLEAAIADVDKMIALATQIKMPKKKK